MGEKLAPFATSCYRIRHVEHQTSWESLKWKNVRFHWPFAIDGHLTSAQVLWPLVCMAGVKRGRGNLGARGLLPPPRAWSRALFPFPFPFEPLPRRLFGHRMNPLTSTQCMSPPKEEDPRETDRMSPFPAESRNGSNTNKHSSEDDIVRMPKNEPVGGELQSTALLSIDWWRWK